MVSLQANSRYIVDNVGKTMPFPSYRVPSFCVTLTVFRIVLASLIVYVYMNVIFSRSGFIYFYNILRNVS